METRTKMTLSTKVTEKEKLDFEVFCQKNGMKQSEMLRLLVSKVCPKIEAGERFEKIAGRKNNQMILRWHQRDWVALGEKAKAEGVSRQQWIRKKIRATIHKTLPISPREIRALDESCYELSAIGRNLNQIAKRLNQSEGADNQMTMAYIVNFAKLVEAHTDKVGAVMRAANGRYGED